MRAVIFFSLKKKKRGCSSYSVPEKNTTKRGEGKRKGGF